MHQTRTRHIYPIRITDARGAVKRYIGQEEVEALWDTRYAPVETDREIKEAFNQSAPWLIRYRRVEKLVRELEAGRRD